MLLTSMKLVDVGVYKGVNTFNFKTEPDRPIILYGGENGTGKTTIFESIFLCLYGQKFDEKKITKKQYHEKIYRLFHKHKNTRIIAHDASIILEFEYARNGDIILYQITRNWQNNDGTIYEFLTMSKKSKNNKKFVQVDVNELQIQDLINQMIPKDIVNMFFFDGEKINNIAEAGSENVHIKLSFDSLLGLDIPNQLYSDIGLYILRNSDNEATAVLAELEHKISEKEKAEKKLGIMKEKYIFLESEISKLNKDLDSKEEKFFKIGGRFAQQRQQLSEDKIECEKNIVYIENGLRTMIEGHLPLVIVYEQLEQITKELQVDKIKLQQSFAKNTLDSAFSDLTKMFTPLLKSYDIKTQDDVIKKLKQTLEIKLKSLSDGGKPTFDFSLSDMDIMLADIDSIMNTTHTMRINPHDHLKLTEKLKILDVQLSVAPKQDEFGSLYSEIKEVTLEIGEMEQELLTLNRLVAQEKSIIVLLNTTIRKCLKKKKFDQRTLRGLGLAPKIQDALDDYSKRLRTQKIKLLESNILKGIQKCFHKDKWISKIIIDPLSYKITLYQDNGDEITREQLSKGELQMYVTAIVWGLAKTSGRPLPFIIDTPLARLDEKHRENMIKNFYPTASHQSIIFSTNTEIVDSYFNTLKPHISNAYLIQYDDNKGGSLVNNGYFGVEDHVKIQ